MIILFTLVITDPFVDIDYDSPTVYFIDERPDEGIEVYEPEPDTEPIRTPGQAAKEIIDSYLNDFENLGPPFR